MERNAFRGIGKCSGFARRNTERLRAAEEKLRSLTRFAALQTWQEWQNEPNLGDGRVMTSFKQIEANRRNALKSTGPRTAEGKQRSRGNAIRHGLTAETVIGALEDAADYKAFEEAITADYDPQSAVERELVLRLASLLWRLRRATNMETALFESQAQLLHDSQQACHPSSHQVVYSVFAKPQSAHLSGDRVTGVHATAPQVLTSHHASDGTGSGLAQIFLRLADLPSCPLDRLSRASEPDNLCPQCAGPSQAAGKEARREVTDHVGNGGREQLRFPATVTHLFCDREQCCQVHV